MTEAPFRAMDEFDVFMVGYQAQKFCISFKTENRAYWVSFSNFEGITSNNFIAFYFIRMQLAGKLV